MLMAQRLPPKPAHKAPVRIFIECPECKRMFRVKPSEVSRRRWCSWDCRIAAMTFRFCDPE